MNVVGIVTEHNPFHNGHLYHVEKSREFCDAELVVSVMSGHFLQRGEPALFNKWARAQMAVLSGVDIVLELPTAFSVRSAHTFCHAAVSMLNSIGIVTHLCFGSECGSIDQLWPVARLLTNEPPAFKTMLNNFLDTGLSFPSARAKALNEFLCGQQEDQEISTMCASPNNILGVEYLRALIDLNSPIQPCTVQRFAAGYHDPDIAHQNPIASATSIRNELQASGDLTDKTETVVPQATFELIEKETLAGRGPVFMANCAKILFYLLRTRSAQELAALCDVSEGLENRILEAAQKSDSVKSLITEIKTKRYTWTRIQRIMSYIMLNYTTAMAEDFDMTGPRYLRILGMSAKGRKMIKTIKKKATLPVILRTAPYLLKDDEIASMLRFDAKATDIYTLLYPGEKVSPPGLDYKIMPYVGGA